MVVGVSLRLSEHDQRLESDPYSKKMIDHMKGVGGFVRRISIDSIHPLVRVHPATGEKSIWMNMEFATGIQGFKQTESGLLLNFLIDHIVKGHDF